MEVPSVEQPDSHHEVCAGRPVRPACADLAPMTQTGGSMPAGKAPRDDTGRSAARYGTRPDGLRDRFARSPRSGRQAITGRTGAMVRARSAPAHTPAP